MVSSDIPVPPAATIAEPLTLPPFQRAVTVFVQPAST